MKDKMVISTHVGEKQNSKPKLLSKISRIVTDNYDDILDLILIFWFLCFW